MMTVALCLAAIGSMSAQKAAVDNAGKLAGKIDKLGEARTLIKGAMSNPETQNDARTYFTAGKIEFDAYDKAFQAQMINPEDPNAKPLDMADELMNGYRYFLKALPLDSMPNEKGQVKPKYSKDINNRIAGHFNDFFTAGANYFNEKKYYPQAYEAFMVYGNLPQTGMLGKLAEAVDPNQIATAFFNAGLSAYSGNAVIESANAFHKAIEAGTDQKEAYIYEIAAWQAAAQRDSTLVKEAQDRIMNVAKAGYDKFGMAEPIFLNNMINALVTDGKAEQAIAVVNDVIAANPDNGDVYGLRGFIYDRMNNDEASLNDYRKAAEMPSTGFETLRNAAKKVYLAGATKWNAIEGDEPALRNDVKVNYFEAAKAIAEKAAQINPTDSDLQNVLESIQYALDTYFNN